MEELYTQLILDEINREDGISVEPYRYYIVKRENNLLLLPRVATKYMNYLYIIREVKRRHPDREDIERITSNYSFEKLYTVLLERIKADITENKDIILYEEEVEALAKLAFWELIGLSRIAPFMYPEFIEEIYCDGPSTMVYVRHDTLGTLDTDIYLTKNELENLINHIEMHKGTNINLHRGNIESEIRTGDFHCRVIVDFDPLAYRGPYIIIRNLKSRKLSIIDLIKNGTITKEAAALLIMALWFRRNVTIAGEVYSGKTTLLNSLDQCIPSCYRRIYIEDALESKDLRREGYKQAFYRGETYSGILDKRKQLIFTLHRSPDILILGELLTNEDIKTFFYSLSCGLRGLQTIHAQDIESLMNRWLSQTKIDVMLLHEIDLIVIMKRDIYGERFVDGIYELEVSRDSIIVKSIFIREDGVLKQIVELAETDIYRKLVDEVDSETVDRLYTYIIDALSHENMPQVRNNLENIYKWLINRRR